MTTTNREQKTMWRRSAHLVDTVRLTRRRPNPALAATWPPDARIVETRQARIRVRDTGGPGPVVLMVPDGPCVVEHYAALIDELRSDVRVVCFDMPGFGFSFPRPGYSFSLDDGASAVLELMDQLSIARASLAFTCANGFYGIAAAKKAPERIASMVLGQTPSLGQMHAWVNRRIPNAVRFPFVGQVLVAATGRRAANRWYPAALPEGTDPTPYQAVACEALVAGGCFCLAGIVQGLMSEEPEALAGVETPTTMVWGARDSSHQPTDPESIKEHLPLVSVERYDDCGHFPDLEQSTRFAALLRGMLRRGAAE